MRRAALALLLSLTLSASAADPTRLDLYGDPLPAGAVARLGTLERSSANLRRFHFAADGKTFHATARGPAWVQFDSNTGKRIRVVHLAGLDGSWPWVSADGSTAVVEQPGGAAHIVDVATGKVHTTIPASAAFRNFSEPLSHDGRYFAMADRVAGGGLAQTVSVCEVRTGKTWAVGASIDHLRQAWFSPDASRLIMMGHSTAVCYDTHAQKELWNAVVPAHEYVPIFRPDGKIVILGGRHDRHEAELLDTDTGLPSASVKQPVNVKQGRAYGFLDGGRYLIAWPENQKGNGKTGLWDTRDGVWKEADLKRGYGQLSPEATRSLWAVGNYDRIQMYDTTTGKELYPELQPKGHIHWASTAAFDPTGQRVFTMDVRSWVYSWDAATGRRVGKHFGPPRSASTDSTLAVSRDEKRLLVNARAHDRSGTYHVINRANDSVEHEIQYPDPGPVGFPSYHHPHFSADGSVIRASHHEFRSDSRGRSTTHLVFYLCDTQTGKYSAKREVPVHNVGMRGSGAISPDGRLVTDGQTVCDFGSGQVVARLERPGERAHGVPDFSADGRFLAVRMQTVVKQKVNPFVRDWRLLIDDDDPPIQEIEVVVPNQVPRVWVWDVMHSRVVGRITVGADHMKLTPDGRFLVTLDATGVSAWDVASGRQLVHHRADPRRFYFEGRDQTTALAVSSDGRLATTARLDGTALVWDMASAYAAAVNVNPLHPDELAATWAAFADPSAGDTLGRMWRLVNHPAASVPYLRGRVTAAVALFAPPTDAAIRAAVAELDDDDFATREAAQKRLGEVGEPARIVLLDVWKKTKSREQRERLSRLLTRLDTAPVSPPAREDAALSWALAVLERVGTPEARDVIRHMAGGPPASRLTREANAALERLPTK